MMKNELWSTLIYFEKISFFYQNLQQELFIFHMRMFTIIVLTCNIKEFIKIA